MSKKKGTYQDFVKVGSGLYRSESGRTRIERGDLLGDGDSSKTWWVSENGVLQAMFNSLKEALSLKWD